MHLTTQPTYPPFPRPCVVRISADYYKSEDGDEVHFERILNWYHRTFEPTSTGASILFPIGALRALRRLTALSNGRCVVDEQATILSLADMLTGEGICDGLQRAGGVGRQGQQQPGAVPRHHGPAHRRARQLLRHGETAGADLLLPKCWPDQETETPCRLPSCVQCRCVCQVNYHAIGMYFISRGGFALHNPQEEASLKVSTFVVTGETHTKRTHSSRPCLTP